MWEILLALYNSLSIRQLFNVCLNIKKTVSFKLYTHVHIDKTF